MEIHRRVTEQGLFNLRFDLSIRSIPGKQRYPVDHTTHPLHGARHLLSTSLGKKVLNRTAEGDDASFGFYLNEM